MKTRLNSIRILVRLLLNYSLSIGENCLRARFKMLFRFILVAFLIVSSSYGQDAPRSYAGYKLLELQPTKQVDLDLLHTLSNTMDFWYLTTNLGEKAHVLVEPENMDKFTQLMGNYNITYGTLINDVEESFQAEQSSVQPSLRVLQQSISFESYARFKDINGYLDELASSYPDLVRVVTVGASYERRQMKVIRISDKNSKVAKKCIFLDAGIHAREWIAPATALYVIHELVENYANNKDALRNLEWIILPVANPDGYEYSHTTVCEFYVSKKKV